MKFNIIGTSLTTKLHNSRHLKKEAWLIYNKDYSRSRNDYDKLNPFIWIVTFCIEMVVYLMVD